jgi:hypothetical protein
MVENDELAEAFAQLFICLKDSIERHQHLVKLLEAAHARLMVALCGREDVEKLLKKAEAKLAH